jgi:CRP-like cAMP-binding protein
LVISFERVPLFSALPRPLLRELAALAVEHRFGRGSRVFSDGEHAAFLPILLAGRVKLFRADAEGREQVLHLVRAPGSFAEAAVFGPGIFPASAEALEESRLATIPRSELLELLARRPEMAFVLLASMSTWMRRLVDLIDGLALRTVEERVAAYLWSMFVRSGHRLLPGVQLRFEEPKQMVAALCGTAPEVLSRTFRKLEREQLVRVEGPLVTLLDPGGLAALGRAGGEL